MFQPSSNTNHWIGANTPQTLDWLSQRNVAEWVPYLLPVLDSLPPTFRFLDVGCGPGSITIDVARRYPSATVIGVDNLEGSVKSAKERAEKQGVKNVEFHVGEGLDLSPWAGFVDVVSTHQVHMHVLDAKKLMSELRKAVRPGGYVCCCEMDTSLMVQYPEAPIMEGFTAMWTRMMVDRGNDPYVGRKLLSHALAAGFKRENIECGMSPKVWSTPEQRREWTQYFMQPLKEAKENVSEQTKGLDLDGLIKTWEEWEKGEDSWRGMCSATVVCRKEVDATA